LLVDVDEFHSSPGGVRVPSPEFAEVQQAFLRSAGGQRFALLRLERVQNEDQWQRHCLLKAQWQQSGLPDHPNERKGIWHGTAAAAKDSIIRDGFNRSFNTTAVYGHGVYFAR
jgi:hypothetical protein